MTILYYLLINLYVICVRLISLFGNEKAKLWINGRKSVFDLMKKTLVPYEKRIWIHASSLGEFEQGRPIIELIKSRYPQYKILLTFFSPSGYEVRKNYQYADYIFYLPMDGPINSKRFTELANPEKAIFIKYEFWHFYLSALHKRNIPVYLCSSIFRKEQLFFKWYGGWYRNILSYFELLFVQNDISRHLLKNIGFTNVKVTGDTRFDRVQAIASQSKKHEAVKLFTSDKKCIVIGSSWEKDEDLLARYINESIFAVKYIIAPHEINSSHLERFENQINKKSIRYSAWINKQTGDYDVLIIDNIGMLSSLYQYGNVAYIGGGFGKGIHNILEAAVWGISVLFGPNHSKFQEALDLIKIGGAFAINDYNELKTILGSLFTDSIMLNESGKLASEYINRNTGATEQIVSYIMSDEVMRF